MQGQAPGPPQWPPKPQGSPAAPAAQSQAPPPYGSPAPGPNPYAQYPPQPYAPPTMYGTYPPQGYGAGYPYAPPYGYYPPIQPDPPGTGNATAAMIFWVLLLLRHIFTLMAILVLGAFFGLFSPTLGLSVAALALMPLIGMIGCVLAIISDAQKKNHNLGTLGAVMAIVGCFPGLLTFGVIGLGLGVIGLICHFLAKPAFTK